MCQNNVKKISCIFTPVHRKLSPTSFPFFFCRSLTQNHHSLITALSVIRNDGHSNNDSLIFHIVHCKIFIMKPFSYLAKMRVIGFLLVLVFFANCKKDNISTNPSQLPSSESILRPGGENLAVVGRSQTRTGNLFNNWGEAIANYWLEAKAQNFSADDDSYASSKKLSFARNQLPLLLQDFRFEIPSNATIQ